MSQIFRNYRPGFLTKEAADQLNLLSRCVEKLMGISGTWPIKIAREFNYQITFDAPLSDIVRVSSLTTVNGLYPGYLLIHDADNDTYSDAEEIWVTEINGNALAVQNYHAHESLSVGGKTLYIAENPSVTISSDTVTVTDTLSGDSITFDVSNSTITLTADTTTVTNGTWDFDTVTISHDNSTTTFTSTSTLKLDNIINIGDSGASTVTVDNATTVTFNTGTKLALDNLVSIGDSGAATVTVDNGSQISFGTSGSTGTKPAGELLLPELTATGEPAWTHSAGNIIVNKNDGTLWYDDGTTFFPFGNNAVGSTTITATTQNDYDLGGKETIFITGSGGNTWTGFSEPYPGKLVRLVNLSSGDETLSHQTGSTSTQQITTPDGSSFTLPAGKTAEFVYDGTTQKYVLIGGSATGTPTLSGDVEIGTGTDTVSNNVIIYGGGLDKPGLLTLYTGTAPSGTPYYYWTDSTGKLRVSTSIPTDEDADGTPIPALSYVSENGGSTLTLNPPGGVVIGTSSDTISNNVTIYDGGADKPGLLTLYSGETTGQPYYVWADSTGNLRIGSSVPTDEDADGTKVGGLTGGSAGWTKYTVNYDDVDIYISSPSATRTLVSLSANQFLQQIVVRPTQSWSGGSISSAYLDMLITPTALGDSKLIESVQLFGASADDDYVFKVWPPPSYSGAETLWSGFFDNVGGAAIKAKVSVGAFETLDDATQGSVDIWLFIHTLP